MRLIRHWRASLSLILISGLKWVRRSVLIHALPPSTSRYQGMSILIIKVLAPPLNESQYMYMYRLNVQTCTLVLLHFGCNAEKFNHYHLSTCTCTCTCTCTVHVHMYCCVCTLRVIVYHLKWIFVCTHTLCDYY